MGYIANKQTTKQLRRQFLKRLALTTAATQVGIYHVSIFTKRKHSKAFAHSKVGDACHSHESYRWLQPPAGSCVTWDSARGICLKAGPTVNHGCEESLELKIVEQPQNKTVAKDSGNQRLKAKIEGGTPPYTYKWYRSRNCGSDNLLSTTNGSTGTSPQYGSISSAYSGQYYLTIKDSNGATLKSRLATVMVTHSHNVCKNWESLGGSFAGGGTICTDRESVTHCHSDDDHPHTVDRTWGGATYYQGISSGGCDTIEEEQCSTVEQNSRDERDESSSHESSNYRGGDEEDSDN